MTFRAKGFQTLDYMGAPSDAAGTRLRIHTYVTTDDRAAVETANYFDSVLARVGTGDILLCSIDTDGTPELRSYVLNIGTSHVVLTAQGDDSGRSTRAVVPTADGLTTGLLYHTDEFVVATSAGANNWLTLPAASEATRGKEIQIWVVPSTNCELRTPAATTDTINNVNCGAAGNEALLTHTQFYIARQHLPTGWLLQAFTALGAVATAIVPD